ncbi:hypothetical protein ACRRTK_018979 [Alexandromys fortis]
MKLPGRENKTAVVVGTVTDDVRIPEVLKLKACALREGVISTHSCSQETCRHSRTLRGLRGISETLAGTCPGPSWQPESLFEDTSPLLRAVVGGHMRGSHCRSLNSFFQKDAKHLRNRNREIRGTEEEKHKCSEEARKQALPVWSSPGKATQASCLPAGPRGPSDLELYTLLPGKQLWIFNDNSISAPLERGPAMAGGTGGQQGTECRLGSSAGTRSWHTAPPCPDSWRQAECLWMGQEKIVIKYRIRPLQQGVKRSTPGSGELWLSPWMEERLYSNSQVRKLSCTLPKDIVASANAKSTQLMALSHKSAPVGHIFSDVSPRKENIVWKQNIHPWSKQGRKACEHSLHTVPRDLRGSQGTWVLRGQPSHCALGFQRSTGTPELLLSQLRESVTSERHPTPKEDKAFVLIFPESSHVLFTYQNLEDNDRNVAQGPPRFCTKCLAAVSAEQALKCEVRGQEE